MNANIRRKIIEKVTEILKENGELRPNKTVKITVSVIDVPLVTVDMTEAKDDTKFLQELLSRMPTPGYRNRMKGAVEYGEITLSIVKKKSLSDMLKYRNIGKYTLREFGTVLRKEGIICPWMNELYTEDLEAVPIEDLGLSIRAENTLRINGLNFVKDFHGKSLAEIRAMRNFGHASIREVQKCMLERGIDLSWHV